VNAIDAPAIEPRLVLGAEAAKGGRVHDDLAFRAFALWNANRANQALRAASARRLRSASGSTRSGSTSSMNFWRNAARAGAVDSRASYLLCFVSAAMRARCER